jgi:hypothetical protein
MARRDASCISIFMPTHRSGRDTEQDPLRLKNLLARADDELRASGLRGPEAAAILEPGRKILSDRAFWQHQQEGLALFLSPGWSRAISTPIGLDESVVVGGRFRVRPLLPALSPDLSFNILALSQRRARLLAATRFTIEEVDVRDMPAGMEAVHSVVEGERQLQSHVAARRGESRAGGSVAFHGHGLGRDAADERLLEYFRAVDHRVAAAVRTNGTPLVVAAVEHFLPLYREATSLPSVIDAAVPGSPDDLSDEELQRRAWPLVAPLAQREMDAQLARYGEHAGKGGTAHSLASILREAQAARVETLFVAVDDVVWGKFDAASAKARIHDTRRTGDEDLFDRAVIETIKTGGRVICLPKERIPDGGPIAAIMRY